MENSCGKVEKCRTNKIFWKPFPLLPVFRIPQANSRYVVVKTREKDRKLVQNKINIHMFSTGVENRVENFLLYVKNLNFFFEFVDFCKERRIFQHFKFYQSVRRNNGGVIAPKNLCNTREGHFCQLAN